MMLSEKQMSKENEKMKDDKNNGGRLERSWG